MNNDIESVLYTQNDLNNRMDEMAAELNKKYSTKDLGL